MVGNEGLDEFHLEIVNTSLDDEAQYECQVGPGAARDEPLIGTAHLTVTGTSYRLHLCETLLINLSSNFSEMTNLRPLLTPSSIVRGYLYYKS